MRQVLMRCFVVLSYYLGVDALFYFLNRHAKRVLVFHNILPDDLLDAKRQTECGCMKLTAFQTIIKEVSTRFRFSTDFADPKTVTVTFDDGYLNQFEVAFKTLNAMGIPGCIFIAGADKPLIMDQLMHWNAYAPLHCLGGLSRSQYWKQIVYPLYAADCVGRGAASMSDCNSKWEMSNIYGSLPSEYVRLRFGSISDIQRQEMIDKGWMVGWHTQNHYPLGLLSAEEIEKELLAPNAMKRVAMAFPYGSDSLTGKLAISLARASGFPFAMANVSKSAFPFERNWFPRMQLSSNRFRLHYVLSGLQNFVLCHRLLWTLKRSGQK